MCPKVLRADCVTAKSNKSSADAKAIASPSAALRTSSTSTFQPRASIARQSASTSIRPPTMKTLSVAPGHIARAGIASKGVEQPTGTKNTLTKPGLASSMSVNQRLMRTTDSSAAKSRTANRLTPKLSSGPSNSKVADSSSTAQVNRMTVTRSPRSEPFRASKTTPATRRAPILTGGSDTAGASAKTRMSLAPSARPARPVTGRASIAAPGVAGSIGRVQRIESGLDGPLLGRSRNAGETAKAEKNDEFKVSRFTEIGDTQ